MAGGGMGRTPYIAHVMSEFVEREDILAYLEAVLRVYNQDSRRDNIHKQRIKILINAIGPEEMRRRVAREFEEIKRMGTLQLPAEELDRIAAYFAPPEFETGLPDAMPRGGADFANWEKTNVHKHQRAGLCHRHHHAEDAGPGAGRRHRRPDGRHRRPDGRIQPGRSARHP